MCKATFYHEPREFTYFSCKERNTAWLHYNNRTILASDGCIAPIPTTMEFKTQPPPKNGNDVTEVPLSPVFTASDDFNAISTELSPTQAKATERRKRNPTQSQRYQAGFSRWLDVVRSSLTTENNYNRKRLCMRDG